MNIILVALRSFKHQRTLKYKMKLKWKHFNVVCLRNSKRTSDKCETYQCVASDQGRKSEWKTKSLCANWVESGGKQWGGAGQLGNPSGRRSWPILSVEVAGQAMVRTKHFWKDMFGRNLPEEWSSMTATFARSGLRAHSAFPLKDWTGLTISSEHIEAINLFG